MAFVIEEIGRTGDYGDDANTERTYYAHDYATEALATAAVLAFLVAQIGDPPNLVGQVLARIAPTETELAGTWHVRVSWKWVEKQPPPAQLTSSSANPTSEDDGELSFDIGVETVKVQWAVSTVMYDIGGDGKDLPDVGTAINFNPKTKVPEGIDVYDPTFGWSETHYFHESKMTRAFRRDLRSCVGKTNEASFRDNEAGEVLCMGVSGKKRSKYDYALTYQFRSRENVTGLILPGMTGTPIDKKGWEYVETVYEEGTSSGTPALPVPVLLGAYVHKPFEEADYSKLGIGN